MGWKTKQKPQNHNIMLYLLSRILVSVFIVGVLVVSYARPESKDLQIILLWITIFIASLGDVARRHFGDDA